MQENHFEEFKVDRILEVFGGRQRFADYVELLFEENARINLVSRETTCDDLYRLIADCLVPVYMSGPCELFRCRDRMRILDIGSGGGLPAFPLALGMKAVELTLIERTGKKADFLRRTMKTLGIKGQALNCNFRDFVANPALRTATGFAPEAEEYDFDSITIRWVKADRAMLRSAVKMLSERDESNGLVYYSATPDCCVSSEVPFDRFSYSYRLENDVRSSRTLTVFRRKVN